MRNAKRPERGRPSLPPERKKQQIRFYEAGEDMKVLRGLADWRGRKVGRKLSVPEYLQELWREDRAKQHQEIVSENVARLTAKYGAATIARMSTVMEGDELVAALDGSDAKEQEARYRLWLDWIRTRIDEGKIPEPGREPTTGTSTTLDGLGRRYVSTQASPQERSEVKAIFWHPRERTKRGGSRA
jgi:hypothetical protein